MAGEVVTVPSDNFIWNNNQPDQRFSQLWYGYSGSLSDEADVFVLPREAILVFSLDGGPVRSINMASLPSRSAMGPWLWMERYTPPCAISL